MERPLGRVILSVTGLLVVIVSFITMFLGYIWTGWLLLIIAGALAWLARRQS
jgi:hypothetical protein